MQVHTFFVVAGRSDAREDEILLSMVNSLHEIRDETSAGCDVTSWSVRFTTTIEHNNAIRVLKWFVIH